MDEFYLPQKKVARRARFSDSYGEGKGSLEVSISRVEKRKTVERKRKNVLRHLEGKTLRRWQKKRKKSIRIFKEPNASKSRGLAHV
jgi:hypothetical protein